MCQDTLVCPPDHREVNGCRAGTTCLELQECGKSLFCEKDRLSDCQALPVCPAGTTEVPNCDEAGGEVCERVTVCNRTIMCRR